MNTEPEKTPEDLSGIAPEQQQAPAPDTGERQEPTAEEIAASRIKSLEADVLDAKEKMMRALADAENTRRRAVKDREDASKFAVSGFAKDLLDFSDNFQRALAAIPEELHSDERVSGIIVGLQAMDSQLLKTFEKNGIKKIEPMDEPFNPNFHEVMFEAPIPGKPGGIIIQVVEAGYVLNDRLLRAAKVGISKADSGNHQVDRSA
ncbi:MAG: nucleotide exchange factor GrpE [Micavibrio aeruginosavorus]|uniref:Protein GrpE n=1 Tax=Micavibrio aeruginosavorus TaxID=349221 RepID=A0A2W4ZB15_9BACT|nr:MAG: nucleotide exchange factor GrpE [Micavibrio aeruginosavorus]